MCHSLCSSVQQNRQVVEIKRRDMVNRTGKCPALPTSSGTAKGRLSIQNKRKPATSPWEFCICRSEVQRKLPPDYPVTVSDCHRGIDCTLEYRGSSCPAAYHGSREGICIGSRGSQGRGFTHSYRQFLRGLGINVGVDVNRRSVELEFRPGNVVHVSRPPSLSGTYTTPIPTNRPS